VEQSGFSIETVEALLHRLYVCEPSARLRKEERKKAQELRGLLLEVERAVRRSGKGPLTLLDAAAGKSSVGLLSAELLLSRRAGTSRVVLLEREPARVQASREASTRVLGAERVSFSFHQGDVGDLQLWPDRPDLVVSLHACGSAADLTLESAIKSGARTLLLVPCCKGKSIGFHSRAEALAEELGVPRAAPVRRRFVESLIDAERALRLQAAGYRTEVVEFVPAFVSPHNLLYRAQLTRDEGKAEEAQRALSRLRGEAAWSPG